MRLFVAQLLRQHAWACCGPFAAWAATACSAAPAPAPSYRLSGPEQSECPRPVRLVSPAEVSGPYRELSRLSVTCPYLVPNACEHKLLARGCELGADAILLTRGSLQRGQALGRNNGELADEAVAIRFQPSPP